MQQTLINTMNKLKTGARIKDYIAIVVRRRWIIGIALLSVVLSTLYYTYSIDDIYESYSVLVIEEQNVHINQLIESRGRSLSFYQGILNSRTFLENVADTLPKQLLATALPKASETEVLDYIQKAILLKTTTYNSFLRLNVRASSRELAYGIASVATETFRRRCMEVETEESRQAVAEIEKQLLLIREKLEQAEHDYRSFVDETGDILEGTTQELSTLQVAYASNLAQLGIKEADLAAEKKLLGSLEQQITPPSHSNSPEFLKLRSRLKELEQEKIKLENLGIRISGFSTIDRDIAAIEKQLLDYQQPTGQLSSVDGQIVQQWQGLRKSVLQKEQELDLFKRKLEMYQKAIENYKKSNPNILSESLEQLRLKRSKETLENVYNLLLQKAEEVRISHSSSSAGIKIVDEAQLPDKPIDKNERRYYILGIIFGLLLGIGLAFFIEFNDTTIKSNDDIEHYFQLPVLGTIPHIVMKNKDEIRIKRRSSQSKNTVAVSQYPRRLLNFEGDDSVITEAYRSLRTNLSFVNPDNPLRVVLLTSAGPGEGKSLTIANLAMAYAQMGKRTLLVDTDLRRPVLHHLFGFKREPGFTELFFDEPNYELCIRPTGKENLSIVTAGIFTPNPAELIGSHKMNTLVDYFRQNFDMVFFDTPPIVAVTDAALLGTKLDGIMLVVKSHHTDRDVVSRALNALINVNVKILGTILNDIDLSHRYSSYGYYKYYYHYYKSKSD